MPETATPALLDPEFLHKLEQLELVSKKIFVGRMKGERKSKRRGSSVEFADHRQYSVGDDLRHIDWNVYGRLDKLFLKLFLEEEDLHFYTLLDTSLSMDFGEPTKLHYGKQVAAALAFIGLVNHDRVMLDTFSTGPRRGDEQRPGPVADVPDRRLPRQAQGRRRQRPDGRRQGVRDQARGQGRGRHHLRLPRQARLRARPPLPPGPEHGHLRRPRPEPARRSSPSSSATSGWSTPRTTTSPRSPSAPRCSAATRTTSTPSSAASRSGAPSGGSLISSPPTRTRSTS